MLMMVPTLMFVGLLAAHSFYVDPCTILHRKNLTDYFLNTTTISKCLDDGFCSGTIFDCSCEDAFIELTESLPSSHVAAPPIIAHQRPFVQYDHPSIDSDGRSAVIRRLFDRIGQMTNRILFNFPRLVYDEEIDGDMLREMVADAKLISGFISYESSTLDNNDSISKLIWSIRIISDYLNRYAIRFQEIDDILVNVAPFVHAFLHVAYYLPIIPDGDLLKCIDYDVLHTVVQYHPLYTNENDQDGIWYIHVGLTDAIQVTLEETDDAVRYVLYPDVEDVADYWGPQFWDPDFPEILLRTISNYTEIETDFRSKRSVNKALFTFKYMASNPQLWCSSELGRILMNAFQHWMVSSAIISQIAIQSPNLKIMRLFGHFLPPTDRLMILPAYSEACATLLVARLHLHIIPSVWSFRDEMEQLARLDRYVLSNFRVYETRITSTYAIQLEHLQFSEYLRRLLEGTFDPENGIFIPVVDSQDPRRYALHPDLVVSMDPQARETCVFVGRLMALILRENFGHILINYLPSRATSDQTIVETIFFGSRDIWSGFYDVYHYRSLDYYLVDNGSLALMAFHGLGREATI